MSNPSLVGSTRPAFGSATPVLESDIKHGCHTQANRGQWYTLVVRRERKEKKHKQSITDCNSTIIYLHKTTTTTKKIIIIIITITITTTMPDPGALGLANQ
jgi:hypothetical protein